MTEYKLKEGIIDAFKYLKDIKNKKRKGLIKII